jgi:hypothetical protein
MAIGKKDYIGVPKSRDLQLNNVLESALTYHFPSINDHRNRQNDLDPFANG